MTIRPFADSGCCHLAALDRVCSSWTWNVVADPRRTTIRFTVERDASVTVAIPLGASASHVARQAALRVLQIARCVRRAREMAPDHPVKQLVGGEGFRWLSRSHRLRLVDEGPPVRLEPGPAGWLRLRRELAHDAAALIAWYTAQTLDYVQAEGANWTGRLGLPPATYRVEELGEERTKLRLGRSPVLTVHWAVTQLCPTRISYVLMRELCHITAGRRLRAAEHARTMAGQMPGWTARHTATEQDWRFVWLGDVDGTSTP
ncbi:YgjP-like metallopeptidase domain-containing protein [Nonomuraea sp. NPDC050790]|uniref:YgjP-like metallopeptidase domain-containing protein n=1 Tax=Nonomuraea sp. NPDC050790 TaxID=3364371 RepID=UPI0037A20B4A